MRTLFHHFFHTAIRYAWLRNNVRPPASRYMAPRGNPIKRTSDMTRQASLYQRPALEVTDLTRLSTKERFHLAVMETESFCAQKLQPIIQPRAYRAVRTTSNLQISKATLIDVQDRGRHIEGFSLVASSGIFSFMSSLLFRTSALGRAAAGAARCRGNNLSTNTAAAEHSSHRDMYAL